MGIGRLAVFSLLSFFSCAGSIAAGQAAQTPGIPSSETGEVPAALVSPISAAEEADTPSTSSSLSRAEEVSENADAAASGRPAVHTPAQPNGETRASRETPAPKPAEDVEGSAVRRQIGRSRKRGYSGAYYTSSKAGSTYSTPLYTPMTYATEYRPFTYYSPTTYYRSEAYYTPASKDSEEFAVSRPYYTTTRTRYYSRPTTTYYTRPLDYSTYYTRPLEYSTYYSRPFEYETYSKGDSYDFATNEYYYRPSTTYTYARPATTYYRNTVDTFSKDTDFGEEYTTEYLPTRTYYRGPTTTTTYSEYRPSEVYRTYTADSKGSPIEEYENLYSSSYYPTTYYSRPATFARPATTIYRNRATRYRYLQNRQLPRNSGKKEEANAKTGGNIASGTTAPEEEVASATEAPEQALREPPAPDNEKENLRALQEADEASASSDSATD